MPKLNWQIIHRPIGGSNVDITSRVLSVNVLQGRNKYLDSYSGGSITFTINNSSDYASGIGYGSRIALQDIPVTGFSFACFFWVQEVTFNDYPGNTGLNTATITAVDWISRAGRVQAENFVLAQANTGQQFAQFDNAAGGPLPAGMNVGSSIGQSIGSAITYTGTVANYLNLLQTTERGYVVLRGDSATLIDRKKVSDYPPIATTLGRTTSSTQIAYEEFVRIQNGVQFINNATISSSGVADQNEINSSSATTYGPAFYSSQTVDYNATQADGNAQWIVNNFSDPASLRFECSFRDITQNSTALASYMGECWGTVNRSINLIYQVPGGSSTTTAVVMEGLNLRITPDSTEFRMTFSPLQYYQFFTLDSSTLGILDTSRLGW